MYPAKLLVQILLSVFVMLSTNISAVISGKLYYNTQQYFESPCPGVFEYRTFENGVSYGYIKVPCPDATIFDLNVEITVSNGGIMGDTGKLDLFYPKEAVVQDVLQRKPIEYRLTFPTWRDVPPKVSKILINGNQVCAGTNNFAGAMPMVTTINLHHSLKITPQPQQVRNLPLPQLQPQQNQINYQNQNDVTQEGYIQDQPTTNNHVVSRHTYNIQDIPSPNSISPPLQDNPHTPRQGRGPKSQTDFKHPFVVKNKYNFNPQMPKNGRVPTGGYNFQPPPQPTTKYATQYPTNPFLNRLVSTSVPNNVHVITRTTPRPNLVDLNVRKQFASAQNTVPTPVQEVSFPNDDDTPKSGTGGQVFAPRNQMQVPFADQCGISVATNSLILNGNRVSRGAYPWLVAMFGIRNGVVEYRCSGSLISRKHVITAGHCVISQSQNLRPKDILLVLGRLNINSWIPAAGEAMKEAAEIHVHPNYQHSNADADMAVIVLSGEVEFTRYIRPICLWDGPNMLENVVGKQGMVVGWGKNEEGELVTAEPNQIQLPIVSQEKCLRSSYSFQYITSDRTFCAGNRNGSGPCNGDSGSGFIIEINGKWHLRGIVSLSISDPGTRSCDLSNYVVFCDASKYLQWILSFLR